jgi:hypothetical protein
MAWVTPEYSRSRVNRAGRTLIAERPSIFEQTQALDVLTNWRASHSFPLNTVQTNLRNKSASITDQYIVAQRLKRVPSIIAKLQRFPKMQLSRMQDIGGCRSVMETIEQVWDLRSSIISSRMRHELSNEKDYINEPKPSGYRGVHLVYQYQSDRNETYNGLQIEVQIRSQLQHAWATAVETIGTFLKTSLKASEGPDEWLEFFRLVGSAFGILENAPLVPNTPTKMDELIDSVQIYISRLDIFSRLSAFSQAIQATEDRDLKKYHYYLLVLRPAEKDLRVTGYSSSEIAEANRAYTEIEQSLRDEPLSDAVLVAVNSMRALRQAYPNYFLDTTYFIEQLQELGLE